MQHGRLNTRPKTEAGKKRSAQRGVMKKAMLDTHEKRSIKALWLAVIRQAIEDHAMWREIQAGRKNSRSSTEDAMCRGGYSWIEGGGPDFQEVCNMAGVDPGWVQTSARKITLRQIKAPVKTLSEQLKKSRPKRPRGRPRIRKSP